VNDHVVQRNHSDAMIQTVRNEQPVSAFVIKKPSWPIQSSELSQSAVTSKCASGTSVNDCFDYLRCGIYGSHSTISKVCYIQSTFHVHCHRPRQIKQSRIRKNAVLISISSACHRRNDSRFRRDFAHILTLHKVDISQGVLINSTRRLNVSCDRH